jgi:hypothetical protein
MERNFLKNIFHKLKINISLLIALEIKIKMTKNMKNVIINGIYFKLNVQKD